MGSSFVKCPGLINNIFAGIESKIRISVHECVCYSERKRSLCSFRLCVRGFVAGFVFGPCFVVYYLVPFQVLRLGKCVSVFCALFSLSVGSQQGFVCDM